jgi:hypothetical protein
MRRPAPPPGWHLPDVATARAELDSFDVIEGLVIQGVGEVHSRQRKHYHSGIDYVTPQQAHQGLRQQIVDQRRIKKLSQRCRRREENQKQQSDVTKTNDKQNTATRLVA